MEKELKTFPKLYIKTFAKLFVAQPSIFLKLFFKDNLAKDEPLACKELKMALVEKELLYYVLELWKENKMERRWKFI